MPIGTRGGRTVWILAIVAALGGAGPRDGERSGDDLTFRPTVIVRTRGGQGSGTIIASVAGETLVLTAAHVVSDPGPIGVELHRYNLGVEHSMRPIDWPVTLAAEVAAIDRVADVAVVRVRGRRPFPFVARLGAPGDEPSRGAAVLSVGIDGGERLESWNSRVQNVLWLAIVQKTAKATTKGKRIRSKQDHEDDPSDAEFRFSHRSKDNDSLDPGERPFVFTTRAPEHGRSGGGLFLEDKEHRLIGVCVGRCKLDGETRGVFASGESVRRLLREHDLETVIARSEAGRGSNRSAESFKNGWFLGR